MEENVIQENIVQENRKKGLGIAAIILGIFSILCCSCVGFGLLVGIVGGIFSIICIVKGIGSGKTFGIIGIILNGIGILLGAYILVYIALVIDWSNINAETLNQINQINPENEQEVINWMQQFFKIDISSYYN